ncbi:MAG: SMI1/KNR4 family protein [Raineya sp.]|jgi:hypothetical protein|nr:SMI1/KNR4 family protein [Raineya sp.]
MENLIYLKFLNPYEKLLGQYIGLNKKEILEIEREINVKLPVSYEEYLATFGKKSGAFLQAYYTEYPSLLNNKKDAIQAINFDERKINELQIKGSYFFFGQWQGYIFYFFDCEEDKINPPVYILTDGCEIKKYKNSFTEFLLEDGLMPILDRLKKTDEKYRKLSLIYQKTGSDKGAFYSSFTFFNILLDIIIEQYSILPTSNNFGYPKSNEIIVSYLLEKSALNKFYEYLKQEFEKHINHLIITPPEISEEDLELDGVYRKYVELKGNQVLLDWHTQEGEYYYFLKKIIDNIQIEIEQNGSLCVLYLKD